ncbi:GntR family transcriptional regulator [Clostridiaceae bacterium 35-E11]
MDIEINRKNGIAIYLQIKNGIMNEIKKGNLKIGEKLPTERELAEMLHISRNTISRTYNLLEQEGVLISYQGRGTFVAEEAKTWKQHRDKDKILKIIDMALEKALEIGLKTEEFLAMVKERVVEKEAIIKNMKAVFVECNIEQSKFFSEQLSKAANLNVMPITVSQIRNRDERVDMLLKEAQIIISTFNHVNEVKDLIGDMDKEVLGVGINPSLKTIVRVAKYPKGTKFGLICASKEFYFKVEYALKAAGMQDIKITATTSKNPEEILELIDKSDVLIVSPGRDEEIKAMVPDKKEVIRFDYMLDQGSVNTVILQVMELKKQV